jgi:outer membrane protein
MKEMERRMKSTMNRVLTLTLTSALALAPLSLTPSLATAQSAPAGGAAPAAVTGPLKLAVMNFEAVALYSNEGQRDLAELQKKYQPRQSQIQSQNAEIDQLTKQLQTQGATLSPAEQASRQHTLETKQRDLQRFAEDAQNDYKNEQQQLFQRIGAKVQDFVNQWATQNGYSLIVEAGTQTSNVIFANPGLDITATVLDAYNVKSGVPAPPSATPAPAQTPRTTPPASSTPK